MVGNHGEILLNLLDKIQRTVSVSVSPHQLDEQCGKYGRTSCVHLHEIWLSLH